MISYCQYHIDNDNNELSIYESKTKASGILTIVM